MKYALIRANCDFDIKVYEEQLKDFEITKVKAIDTDYDDEIKYIINYIEIETPLDFYKLTHDIGKRLVISNYYNTPLSYNTVKCPTITVYDDYLE